ncbi:EAL domain-containing protein [Spirulina sp. CS-785/01]|uniref:EAL domain-containing protein n=1 Tax=Spirulina sp. CS-785/01 TaxID=3021716 RepID=UPI00232FEE8F|nr:EAL domain-containing protein [Spirulina sp. CS-785/01]MDB9313011.1 EAL domain-containing protein [Spirulina sp. CS-785/01]
MKFAATLGGFLVLLLLVGGEFVRAEKMGKTVRVGIYENKPKVFVEDTGNPAGFWVDVLEDIAEEANWSLDYVVCKWEDCLQQVEEGELDLMVDVAYSEERDLPTESPQKRTFDFNQEVVLTSWSEIYTRSDGSIDSLLELDQKRVAVVEGSIQETVLTQRVNAFAIEPQFVRVDQFQEIPRLLEEEKVDAGVVNHFFGREAAKHYPIQKTNILIGPSRLHFIVAEGQNQQLLTTLDQHLRSLIANPESAYYQAQERWLKPDQVWGWQDIRNSLIQVLIYLPLVILVAFVVWNRVLRREIERRKQAEAALLESEQRFQNMAKNVPGAIFRYVLHPDGSDQVIYMSPGCYDLWEIQPEAVVQNAQVLWDMVHPDDREGMYESVQESVQTLQPWFWQWRIITPSRQLKWLEAAGRPERQENGDVVWDTLIMDVSDRKRNEAKRQQIQNALRTSENRYRKVVEAQTDFILRSRPDTTITFANEALCRALGVTLDEIVGKKWSDFANASDLENQVFEPVSQLSPQNPRCIVENRDQRSNGAMGWTQWLNEGIFDDQGELVEIQSVGRDITELKRAEQALRESEERLRLVTENMSDLVCLHEPDGRYLYVTPSSQSLLGYSPEELIGRNPYDLFHPDDLERIRQDSHNPALQGESCPMTYRIRTCSGHYIWLETLTKAIVDEVGNVVHLQTTSRDVSDRIKAELQLKHDALHDGLTGLPNRNLLMERLDLALKRAKRSPTFQFAVLFLDLDHFKVVNDSLGHITGDELLLEVANLLCEFIRDTDLAARLGGDEFVILLEEIQGIERAIKISERILAALRSPLQVTDREVFTSTSIGIVMQTPNHHQAEDILRDADLAMYRAKQRGRGRYAIFNPTMHLKVVERLHLENDLRKALENQELLLYYQPIVHLESQKIRGFEALLRWQHPRRGFVSPGEFIPIAEETGLIIPIGRWVLHTACQQLALWQADFPDQSLSISVNLSVRQLQKTLLGELQDILQTYDLPGNCLVLEITESMLVKNVEFTRELLSQIQFQGIRLSIDDFGTGYSSLSYLRQLPVDDLKIDRAFVNSRECDARNQVIAESIIALSNLLELNAIAEGIETPEQLEWLKTLGCEFGQGFLFSPPLPPHQVTPLLQLTISN